jgi:hypothetical protein
LKLLCAGPAVINLFSRIGYLALAPISWLFTGQLAIQLMIAFMLISSIPMTIISVAFPAMFAEMIPPEQGLGLIGRRPALTSISMTVTTLICGQLLDWLPPMVNYPVAFGIGVIGSIMSANHLRQWRLPVMTPALAVDWAHEGVSEGALSRKHQSCGWMPLPGELATAGRW